MPLVLLLLMQAVPDTAQDSRHEPVVVIGRRPTAGPCVPDEKEQPACAAERLQAVARAAQARAAADPWLSVPDARSADPAVGTANVAATSNRIGADVRTITSIPARPARPTYTSPAGPRP